MRLKPSLPMAAAVRMIETALAEARAHDMLPMSVVVLNVGGQIIASQSEDGSGVIRFEVALGKAYGALGMGISSRLIRDRLAARPVFQSTLGSAAGGKFIPVPGGVLVEDQEGYTIGAVGISGDTSEKDEYCAITAIQTAGFASEPSAVDPNWQASSLSDKKD